ncbi:DEAD/DEAH box helicase [soil metagenome]
MGNEIAEGLYEHVVTEQLARKLDASPASKEIRELDDADAHAILARHVAQEVERALNTLPREDRVEKAREIANNLLEHLATLVGNDAAEAVRDQLAQAPGRRLLAVHRGAQPERPSSPLSTSTLLTRNRRDPALGHEISREIATSDRVDAIVAFVTVGGVRALQESLHQFARRDGAALRLLTTTFTGTTEVAALDMIARLPGARVKVSYDTRRTRLHAKAWLFHRDTGLSTCYVGSANLTSTALGSGQEWMVKACRADVPHVVEKFEGTFETLWEDPEFEHYDPENPEHRSRLQAALNIETAPAGASGNFLVTLRPFPFQVEILDKLTVERTIHGRKRNLVVAATGTGKTVIAAFDYARQCEATGVPPRLLFIAHRRELLEQARKTFQYVLQDASFGELLVGGTQPSRYEHVFASIQSVASSDLLERLGPSYFRHVIVDECHHMPASSYQTIVPSLMPELLVGLTATPERADGKSLLPDFDNCIAAELRLWNALDDQLLVPFEYYGISDVLNLPCFRSSRTWCDDVALVEIYTGNEARADLIRHQLARRVNDVRRIRAIGFCVSVEHAEFMAARFNAAGIPSRALHGGSTAELRESAPALLRERAANVLFTCDLYNEGVDLPFVDTLLLLRSTSSSTVFLQQLGRGLRHNPGKSSCLVLDFIGQHRDEFRFDATLAALTGIPRANLRKSLEDGFPYLPSGCALQLDSVARDQILASLRASLGGAKRLTAELRELAAAGNAPTLGEFLEQTGRELDDVYDAGGWSTLRRRADIEPPADEETDDISRRLGWLAHIDEDSRLRTYATAVAAVSVKEPLTLSETDRRRIQMLDYQIQHRGVMRAAEQTIQYIASRPSIAREFQELHQVLDARVALAAEVHPVPEWPLALHHHYSRREIIAAVGFVKPGEKGKLPQGGILRIPGETRELLFVTLDKSGKEFSPTTRYRDYAISPELFHWETQAAASVTRPSGKRYVESRTTGWEFYLFVRTNPEAVYGFLGPVRYESHNGDRPIAITWRLETPMAPFLYERYATLRSV